MMQIEVDRAVQFICGLLRARSLSLDLVETFRTVLCEVMYGRYEGHWFPDKPCKGSAYRCMRIHDHNMDPLIVKAGAQSGLTVAQLFQLLPNQLTIWVDPQEVAYRIGEDGSIGVLYDGTQPEEITRQDDDLSTSSGIESGSSSIKSSPSQSPVPTDDDSDASPRGPPLSCRQEMTQQGELRKGTGGTTGGKRCLNSVLIASSWRKSRVAKRWLSLWLLVSHCATAFSLRPWSLINHLLWKLVFIDFWVNFLHRL